MLGLRTPGHLLAGLLLLLVLTPSVAAAADEPLAIVVPAGVDHGAIDASQLAAIYRRKRRFWSSGAPIEPVNLGATDPRRLHFSLIVLGLPPEAMEDYWDEQYFHGVLPPRVLASPEAILRFVTDTPGAIGYVPLCSADRRVTIVAVIDGTVTPPDANVMSGCHR